MYNNDPHAPSSDEWRNADWEKVEDLSDEFFVYWWKAKPKATRWANLPMDSIVDTGWDAGGWRQFPPPQRVLPAKPGGRLDLSPLQRLLPLCK